MTNEDLELQALEAELAALEETEKVKEPKLKRRPKPLRLVEPEPTPEPEPPAPAAPAPPAPVAAPMPEPEVTYAPVVRKAKDVRPTRVQGDSNRGIRRRF